MSSSSSTPFSPNFPLYIVLSFILPLFFFNDTATTEIYTLSLHDALPISASMPSFRSASSCAAPSSSRMLARETSKRRSEEHTSELQSHVNLVCRLLLEKKKKINYTFTDVT